MVSHYYGDEVRRLFMAAAIIMALSLPFFWDIIDGYIFFPILAIVLLGMAAGVTNPRQIWVVVADICISVLAAGIFEFVAIRSQDQFGWQAPFFWTNQLLAVIFIVSIYYSVKTLRAKLIGTQHPYELDEDEDKDGGKDVSSF